MSTTATYHVAGMHCASCPSLIERTVGKLASVATVSENYANESMNFTSWPSAVAPVASQQESPLRTI